MEEEKVKGFLGEWLEKSGKVEVMCPQPLEDKPKRWWKRSFRFGRFYLTFSNCRVKKRLPFHNTSLHCKLADNLHDILMERLESEFGEIDYGIPSDWLPQPRARRTRREPTSIELQLNFNFFDDGIDSITDRDNFMRGSVQKGNKKAKRKGVQRIHNV